MVWDEENRLRGINDNGRLHLYTYDHTGERALKSSAESSLAVINGATSATITHTEDYTAYISPYFVVNKGKFTKHYFEGSSRVVSKLGEGTFVHKNTGIMAGGIDYIAQSAQVQTAIDQYIRGLQVPPGPPTQQGIYATPEWTGNGYPSIDWQAIAQNQEPPEGWPRPPKFNEPGDVPGSPVQFGEAITNANVKAGYGFIPNGVEEKNLYFYHPDHLGSSSYITDREGQVIQHTEYIAFGEVLVDEHSVSKTMPYLFNGKELDYETGLYYYGARYYDSKVSIFLNVDPLVEKTGTPYAYTYNNPIRFIDPTGMEAEDWVHNRLTNQVYWNENATSQATAGVNETYLGKSGTYTAKDGSYVNLNPKGGYTKSSFNITKIGVGINLDPLIQGGNSAPIMSVLTFGHDEGTYIRETPASNSPEVAMGNPSGRLAVAGLYGLQGGTSEIAASKVLGGVANFIGFGKGSGRVFWSGGDIAKNAAADYAVANGGRTLEMTWVGRGLEYATEKTSYNTMKPFWDYASYSFGRGAKGDVNVFINQARYRSGSIWNTVERPLLQSRGIKINAHLIK